MEEMNSKKFTLKERLKADKGYYEIRLESIGGLGANLCGKMLGELGIKYLDLNSSSFSSYGSEKTGTPVKGYIRYCEKDREIRLHSPVVEPDVLAIFHQALLKDPSVLSGCTENTAVIVALGSQDDEEKAIKWIGEATGDGQALSGCYGLEAQKIAIETKSRINVVMLGAILKVMGLESVEEGKKIITDVLGKKYPEALKGNILGLKRGYEEVRGLNAWEGHEATHKDCSTEYKQMDRKPGNKAEQNSDARIKVEEKGGAKHQKWGYKTAPIGGINPRLGSTVIANLSPSRQGYIPIFIKERCINCGQCHLTCPDMVFQFAKGEYKGKEMMVNQGLDYYHCKGCLRCVDICPVNALVMGVEAEHLQSGVKHFMANQELIRMPKYYEDAGADGYITSEAYVTEERIEGGEV